MNPQDVAALMALLQFLDKISTWPFGVLFFMMIIGPWLFAFVFWRMDHNQYKKKDEMYQKTIKQTLQEYQENVSQIRSLYESNSRLVVSTNEAFKRLEVIYKENVGVVSLCTQAMTKLVDDIEKNQYCPIIRDKGGPSL